ncbi:hypothetical protein GNF09_28450 [Nostoc sp. UCD120]|nr:hypothetical protein [Nostoc sp. UCD120]
MNTAPLLAKPLKLKYYYSPANMTLARLEQFRQVAYKYLGRAKDLTLALTRTLFYSAS